MPNLTPLEAAQAKDLAALREEIESLRVLAGEQQIIIKTLRDQIDLLLRQKFGKSSEQMDAEQLMLLLQGAEAKKPDASQADVCALEAELKKGEAELAASKKKPCKGAKVRIPTHLPVIERIEIDPKEVKAEPEAYRCIGEEVTEQIAMKLDGMGIRQIVRKKYVKKDEPQTAPIIAELDTLQERSIAAPSLIAYVVTAKYCDHLPLYRLEKMFERNYGVRIPRQTQCDWIGMAAEWFEPIYGLIHRSVVEDGYIQTDETVIKYLLPGNGEAKQGYFWAITRPRGYTSFVWSTNRAGRTLSTILPENFQGIAGCDGYGVYQSHAKNSEGRIELAACWAHARRKFDEAKQSAPRQAATVLYLIQHLYKIEAQLRQAAASAKERGAKRASSSTMIVERIGALLERWKKKGTFLPSSLMSKAISYTLNLWEGLQVYLKDGRVEIDNNLVENAIRPTAVGKKNWLFIGHAAAGQRSAILFTIIQACKQEGIDPRRYMTDVLTRLPTMTNQQYDQLLPKAWAKEQQRLGQPAQTPRAQQSTASSQAVG